MQRNEYLKRAMEAFDIGRIDGARWDDMNYLRHMER